MKRFFYTLLVALPLFLFTACDSGPNGGGGDNDGGGNDQTVVVDEQNAPDDGIK